MPLRRPQDGAMTDSVLPQASPAAPANMCPATSLNPLPDGGQLGGFDSDFDALLVIDAQQRIMMANPAALRLFGYRADDLLGSPLSCLLPLRFRDAHATLAQGFMASGDPDRAALRRQPVVGLHTDGHEFSLEVSISRLAVAGVAGAAGMAGAPVASQPLYTALLRDLSAPADAAVGPATLTLRLRSILDLAPTAIWIADGDRIVFANRACAALFGTRDHRQLMGCSIYSLLVPESHATVRLRVAQALAAEQSLPLVSERIVRFDGGVREVEIAVAAMPDHGRTTMQMVIRDVTERQLASRMQERTRRELRQLTANLVEAREEERRRIARELHDELGQRLTALKMELAGLFPPGRPPAPASRMPAMLAMVDDTVAAVRRIATDLRPAMLDDLGLNAAIEWLAGESGRRLGLAIRLHLPADEPQVGNATATALYRMVQEALTNIARHAQASEVHITLRCDAEAVALVVQDNGRGFAELPATRRGTHGLMGLRERCHMLGGSIVVDNAPEGGARIRIRLPRVLPAPDTQPGELPAAASPPGALPPTAANAQWP